MKTGQQIEKLKEDWLADPCWDIADTEGFEDYRAELQEFQRSVRAQWSDELQQSYYRWAENAGCPGNRKLGEMLHGLYTRIDALEQKLAGA